MINLPSDELRLLAEIRNTTDYENKSKEDLIKALSETKPKPETKPQTTIPKPKPQASKPETKPQTSKAKPEGKPEIRVNKRKLKKTYKRF